MTGRGTEQEIADNVQPIRKEYGIALLVYLLPRLFLGLWVAFEGSTQMVFFVVFLLSALPCAIGGLVLSIIGLRSSWKSGDMKNRILGAIGVLVGAVLVLGGILGPMLLYVAVGP
jgi:hypothetical protein